MTMPGKDPAPSLLTTWRGVDEWELEHHGPGHEPTVVPKYSYGYVCNYHYAYADFAQIHPLLPEALSHYFQNVLAICPAHVITRMLEYWKQEIIALPETAFYGDSNGCTENHYVGAIHKMSLLDGGLFMSFNNHTVHTTPTGLLYGTSVERAVKTLDATWLNLHHPGWQERFHTGNALELPGPELQAYLFSPATPAHRHALDLAITDLENFAPAEKEVHP